MEKIFIPLSLLLVVLLLAGIVLLAGGGDPGDELSFAAQATATYSAEQFHIQLTAIAVQGAQP